MLLNKLYKIVLVLMLASTLCAYDEIKIGKKYFQYTVNVSTLTHNFTNAKNDAIYRHRELALEVVLKRMTDTSHFKQIEDLITPDIAKNYENMVYVNDENMSNNYYTANITYIFYRNKLYQLLKDNNIPYIVTNSDYKYLVIVDSIPYFSDKQMDYIASQMKGKFFSHFTLANMKAIDKAKILQRDASYIDSIKKEYDIDDILVLYFSSNALLCNLNVKRGQQLDALYSHLYFDLNTTTYDSVVYSLNNDFNATNIHSSAIATLENYFYTIEDMYKIRQIKSVSVKNKEYTKLPFKVYFNDIGNFVYIRDKIRGSNGVKGFTIRSINDDYIQVDIMYNGSLKDFQYDLKEYDIEVDSDTMIISCNTSTCY